MNCAKFDSIMKIALREMSGPRKDSWGTPYFLLPYSISNPFNVKLDLNQLLGKSFGQVSNAFCRSMKIQHANFPLSSNSLIFSVMPSRA